jgi:hypothetical protein
MRKTLIVGAGQAGLQLGLCLLANGYEVTIMSARTPEEMRTGRITSTQVLFGPSLTIERDAGLNLWEQHTPGIEGIEVTLSAPPGNEALYFVGPFPEPAQSVDQRVKMAGWLELFEDRGGKVIFHSVMTSDLEGLSALYDLTIIAAGKGELVELFDRDASRSPFDRPQRALACIYLHGVTGPADERHSSVNVGINVAPGVGELFSIPAYTTGGPCHIELWEAVPGGPFDCWRDRPSPAAHLERSLTLMREYMPWEYDRCVGAEPTDARCTLTGGYAPIVRHPIGRLSPDAIVLGMGDVVVANDPIAGQGANNATHCADIYLRAILERGDRPFDAEWMQGTFDAYWAYARPVTDFSNMLLRPLPEHVQGVLGAAARFPEVARRFAYGYTDPADFENWITDPARAEAYLASVAGAAQSEAAAGEPAS